MLSHPEPKTAAEVRARYLETRRRMMNPKHRGQDLPIDLKRAKPGWRTWDTQRASWSDQKRRERSAAVDYDDSSRIIHANAHVLAFYQHMAAQEYRKVSKPKIEHVVADVLCALSVSLNAIRGDRRDKEIVRARHAVQYAVLTELDHVSLAQAGRYFNRDHTAVMSGRDKMRRLVREKKVTIMTTPLGRNFYYPN